MATTTYSSLRYPLSSATPNVSQDIQNLANDVDQMVTRQVADATARNALTSKYDGMRVYEQATQRWYRWDGPNSAWVYAGGASPPIAACTIQGGWANLAGHAVGVYKDAAGLVHLVGGVSNSSSYNPNVSAAICQIPSGYYNTHAAINGLISLGTGGQPPVAIQISTSGMLSTVGSSSTSVPINFGHWLESMAPFHTTYAGTVPLA